LYLDFRQAAAKGLSAERQLGFHLPTSALDVESHSRSEEEVHLWSITSSRVSMFDNSELHAVAFERRTYLARFMRNIEVPGEFLGDEGMCTGAQLSCFSRTLLLERGMLIRDWVQP